MLSRRQAMQRACAAGLLAAISGEQIFAEEDAPRLSVLSYNIWVGGQHGGVEQTARVIRTSQADLVGIQENSRSGPRLAELTGLELYEQGGRSQGAMLSRFPIVEESANHWGIKVQVPERGPVWLFNAHLPAAPYQPYQLAGIPYGDDNPLISTATEAIAEAIRARGQHVASLLMDVASAIRANEPLLLTGDFNEPSHLDWTDRAAASDKCQLPVAWPTSRSIVDAGLMDVYRTVHTDEVARPGHTWTPLPAARDVPDRIDIIYTRGLNPLSAHVIGETAEQADIVVDPYPSDHRAVVATLTWP